MKIDIPCNILIVDDDYVSNFVSKNTLLRFNKEITCITYEDPTLALAYLNDNSQNIDFLLLDINMPMLDGWRFLDSMEEKNIQLPVYMLTSSINPKDIERALTYKSVLAFWKKPLTYNTLEVHFETA